MHKRWFVALVLCGVVPAFGQTLLAIGPNGTASESCGDGGGWAVDLEFPILGNTAGRGPLADRELFIKLNGASLAQIAGRWTTTDERRRLRADVAPKGGWPHVFATRGAITIMRITDTLVEGNWNLTFEDLSVQERVEGAFKASIRRWTDIVKPGTRVICQ